MTEMLHILHRPTTDRLPEEHITEGTGEDIMECWCNPFVMTRTEVQQLIPVLMAMLIKEGDEDGG